MIDVISDIKKTLDTMTDREVRARTIKKSDLTTLIDYNIKMHKDLEYVLDSISDNEMRELYATAMVNLGKSRPDLKKAYETYTSKLTGKAAGEEGRRPLGSLLKANADYHKALTQILNKIDTLIEEERIVIHDARVSFIAFLGMLQQSSNVINFTSYAYTTLVRAMSNGLDSPPKYRQQFIIDKGPDVAQAVNLILSKRGPYEFLAEINRMRSRAQDSVLGKNIYGAVPKANAYVPAVVDYLISALSCLNIVGASIEMWDDYRLWRAARMRENKEWLESHTAILRLQLEKSDPSSAEYKKMSKVIESYDRMIADYDRRTTEFEND